MLAALLNYVPQTQIFSSLSQNEVMVVSLLHGAEFITWKVMFQLGLIKETRNTMACPEGKEETSSFSMMSYGWLPSTRQDWHSPEPNAPTDSEAQPSQEDTWSLMSSWSDIFQPEFREGWRVRKSLLFLPQYLAPAEVLSGVPRKPPSWFFPQSHPFTPFLIPYLLCL